MGQKGSEAAKEAAELVLADDNFASIVAAVRERRTVHDNIKKVISWTLPTNAGESMTIVVALFAGMALPITAVQILWINLITGVTLGLALAFEPSEPGTMRRPPRPREEPLLTGGLIWHIVLVSILFLIAVFGMYFYAIDRGYPVELAQTMAMNTLVVLEIFHLFFIGWPVCHHLPAPIADSFRHSRRAASRWSTDRCRRRRLLCADRDGKADAPCRSRAQIEQSARPKLANAVTPRRTQTCSPVAARGASRGFCAPTLLLWCRPSRAPRGCAHPYL